MYNFPGNFIYDTADLSLYSTTRPFHRSVTVSQHQAGTPFLKVLHPDGGSLIQSPICSLKACLLWRLASSAHDVNRVDRDSYPLLVSDLACLRCSAAFQSGRQMPPVRWYFKNQARPDIDRLAHAFQMAFCCVPGHSPHRWIYWGSRIIIPVSFRGDLFSIRIHYIALIYDIILKEIIQQALGSSCHVFLLAAC